LNPRPKQIEKNFYKLSRIGFMGQGLESGEKAPAFLLFVFSLTPSRSSNLSLCYYTSYPPYKLG